MADKNFRVKNGLDTPLIADANGTTAITLNGSSATIANSLTVSGGVISGPGAGGDLVIDNASTIQMKNDYLLFSTDAATTKAYFNNSAGKYTFNGTDGDNTNNYNLYSHGTLGSLGNTTVGGTLFLKGSSSGSVGIKGAAAAGSTTYTLPSADGTSGYVLSTNGAGTLSWVAQSGGGGSGSPAGSNQQIQYNNSGSFGASSGLTYDGVSLKVSSGNVESLYQSGDEGGEFRLNKPVTNTSLAGSVSIDIYQNKLRIFENGGSSRGAYIDLTQTNNSVATNLLSPIPAVKSESLSTQPWSTMPGCMYIGSIANALTITAQTVRYHPFYVTQPITLTELALSVSTATTLASCNAMIYIVDVNLASTGWQPTSNRSGGYAGEIANITTAGIKSIAGLSISLPIGAYLIAVQFSNFTGTLQCRSLANQVITGNGYCAATSDGTTYAMTRTGVTYTSGTPATAGAWTNGAYGSAGHPGLVLAKWTVN